MDEVWKDINFPSFQEHSSIDHLRSSNFRSTNFQHLFSLSFSTSSSSRYGSPVPPPATMLTLNTTHESHLFRSNGPLREVPPLMQYHTVPKICPHSSKPVDFFPDSNAKKRQSDIDSSNSDKRHKRMIKNRDAAARSRARNQESAYTDELELEVAYLVEENARLRKQQKQLCLAAAQQPEKRKFYRATSAPL
ncbi:basic leucine zipper transcription factor [Lithospermum erythrorhizon]|uniref:Basic leucine zipper transcription factor n=1 Tax=Lithospermum erythrorhizon TaxID=34254 RepID=A0AAV3Q7N5_LITER